MISASEQTRVEISTAFRGNTVRLMFDIIGLHYIAKMFKGGDCGL